MICVEIEIDDSGNIFVGVCPPENEDEPKEHLNPAKNLDDALSKAKSFLDGSKKSMQESVLSEMGMK